MPKGAADQPLSITPPLANYSDGPAGFLHEPGHALDGSLRNHFILDQFPNGKMDAFTLEPDLDSFRQTNLRTINKGIMGIGMTWAPDGRAYFADWIGGYPLDGKGAVWRMDVAGQIDQSSETILSQPLSSSVPKAELLRLLGHRDQRVRVNASLRLDRLAAWDDMLSLAQQAEAPRFARIHAIWGYGMGLRHGKVVPGPSAYALMEAADPEIRTQALKVFSEAQPNPALTAAVSAQLNHVDYRVRTQAGITLGKIGGKVPFERFFHDASAELRLPWLRHGLVTGLVGTQSPETLLAVAQAKPEAEAVFATLALARLKSPLLAALLRHKNPEVVTEAARAIHDDEGIPDAAPALAQVFGDAELPYHAARRALNANLRQGDDASLRRLIEWTLRQPAGAPLRLQALQVLSSFDLPPALDQVDGTARKHRARDHAAIAAILRPHQASFLAIQQPEERAEALSLMVRYELEIPFPVLLALAGDLKASPAVRLQTLRLLGRKQDEPEAILRTLRSAAGEGNPSEVRIEAVSQLFRRDTSVAMEVALQIINSKSAKAPEKQAIVLALRGRTDAPSLKLLQELTGRLAARKLDAGLKWEVFDLARLTEDVTVTAALQKYLTSGPKGGLKMAAPGLPYELLTDGGDAVRGKAIINGHLGANCTACHRVDSDEGSEVGPILRNVGAQRTKDELAESLIEPSVKIVPGYGIETIALKDGSVLAGSVVKSTAKSLELRLPDGSVRKVEVSAVVSRTPPISIMPPMLGILTPEEIRDAVAYLSSLKPKAAKPKAEKKK